MSLEEEINTDSLIYESAALGSTPNLDINRLANNRSKRLINKSNNLLNEMISKRNSVDDSVLNLEDTNRFIKIWIETLLGVTYEVCILPDEPIFNLKLKLEIEEDVPVLYQTLYYGDDELNDSFTIEEYAIEHGATLKLVLNQMNDEENKKYIDSANHLQRSSFAIDEKTYYEVNHQPQKKQNSLTDTKSIDEFRLTNLNSNLGCISVNDRKINDRADERSSRNTFDTPNHQANKMKKWSLQKRLLDCHLNQPTNDLKNKARKLSDQMGKHTENKNLNFFGRFISNSSFNLVTYCQDDRQMKEDKESNTTHKSVRPASVAMGDVKSNRVTSSIHKSHLLENGQLVDQLKKISIQDNCDKDEIKIDQLKKQNIINGNRRMSEKGTRIKLPPVNVTKRKKSSKCSKCKNQKGKEYKCLNQSSKNHIFEQNEDTLIRKLNVAK